MAGAGFFMLAHFWSDRPTNIERDSSASPTRSMMRSGPASSTTTGPTEIRISPSPLSGVCTLPESNASGRPLADLASTLKGSTESGGAENQNAHVHVRVNGSDIARISLAMPSMETIPCESIATRSAKSANRLTVTISFDHGEVEVVIPQHVCGNSEPVSAV